MMTALLIIALLAQAPDTLWTRTYGGEWYDEGLSVQQTFDSGFIVSGYTEGIGGSGGERHAWLLKTDPNGDTVWTRILGHGLWDEARCVRQTPDSGHIVAGTIGLPSMAYDVLLVRTGPDGTVAWTKTFGDTSVDEGNNLCLTSDAGYAIAGKTRSYSIHGGMDAWTIRTDENGDTLWTHTYGRQWTDEAHEVVQTPDGGFAVAGFTTTSVSSNGSEVDVFLLKLDANGDSVWARLYEARPAQEEQSYGYGMAQTADSGFIVVGSHRYFDDPTFEIDLLAVRTDAGGDTMWARTYDMAGYNDVGRAVRQLTDGGFLIAGYTIVGPNSYDVFLLRLDAHGDTLWTKTVGRPETDEAWSFDLTADGGFIVAARTGNVGPTRRDLWLVRLGPEPVAVAEPAPRPERSRPRVPSVIGGQLLLPAGGEWRAHDVQGREVRDLGRLRPGVYFLRAPSSRGKTDDVHKIIIAR
jgi:hypothetical protein